MLLILIISTDTHTLRQLVSFTYKKILSYIYCLLISVINVGYAPIANTHSHTNTSLTQEGGDNTQTGYEGNLGEKRLKNTHALRLCRAAPNGLPIIQNLCKFLKLHNIMMTIRSRC